jgi:Fe-Mn family superoxide dismutase
MKHEAKNFDHLVGKLEGISEAQIKAHLGLYQGYVNKLNEIEEKLQNADPKAGNYSYNEFSELKRRESVAFNGTYLHQLYFENLAAPGQKVDSAFEAAAIKSYGSWDKYVAHVKGTAASTPGWVITTYSKVDGTLHTYVMYEHHVGLPVHQEIILALDCWEHAYMIDFGTAKPKYLDAFLSNVNWQVVGERLKKVANSHV